MISPAKETHPWQVLASLWPAENRLQRNNSHSHHYYYCSLLQLTQRVTLCRQPNCTVTSKSGELVATDSKADGLWDGGGSSVGVRMSNKHDRASSKGKTLLTLMPHDLLVVTQLYIDDDVFQNIFCAIWFSHDNYPLYKMGWNSICNFFQSFFIISSTSRSVQSQQRSTKMFTPQTLLILIRLVSLWYWYCFSQYWKMLARICRISIDKRQKLNNSPSHEDSSPKKPLSPGAIIE